MTLTITSTKNQKKQINDNVTTIDLGKCETKLKNEYNISMNDSLYILKIDIPVDNIQNIEYEIFYNFSANNLTKLNLSVCKNIKIDISIPKDIPINEIDKYNKSSGYYNDLCYTLKDDKGIDEPLEDRRNDYKNNNMSICEEDCDFTGYNFTTKKAICSCYTKINLPLQFEIKFDKQKIFSNIKDIRNIGNFKMLSCIKLFLNKFNICKNFSNYMSIMLLILSLISILIFSFYDFKKIKESINNNEKKIHKKKTFKHIMTTNNKKERIENVNNNLISIKINTNKSAGHKTRIINNNEEYNKSLDNTYKSLEREKKLINEKLKADKKLIRTKI